MTSLAALEATQIVAAELNKTVAVAQGFCGWFWLKVSTAYSCCSWLLLTGLLNINAYWCHRPSIIYALALSYYVLI